MRLVKHSRTKIGMKPGAVVYVGEERQGPVLADVIDYTVDQLSEWQSGSLDKLTELGSSDSISWINLPGVHDIELVSGLGERFGLHQLILEDIVNCSSRPKYEEGGESACLILKMLYRTTSGELKNEQISVVFGKQWVISFQETKLDVLEHVRERVRKSIPRKRFMTADYLAYSLADAIVDHYFLVLEHVSERVEEIEDKLISHPEREDLEQIYALKREMAFIRKAVWPLREAIGAFERTENDLLNDGTRPYLRDLYEHVIQVIDTVETLRDMVSGLLDFYLSSVSNKMNEVMKVLTIMASVFIPLGFLAGVYGMNFDTNSPFNLPELGFKYGYFLFWGLVLAVGGGQLWMFKRKRWL
ncbi:MAG: magnesium/cobalt transporter CorA [bacterium]|nr:magnesium/cobalt transporter CorA [bacterium]